MSSARRELIAEALFVLGVAGKAIDAVIEVLVGVPLLILGPGTLNSVATTITADTLSEDPDDFIANLIVHGAAHLTGGTAKIIGVYLLFHGLVKIGIVVGLLFGSHRFYPWTIGALAVFLVVQGVQFAIHPSVGVALLTVLDAFILWLAWREWRQGRSLRDAWRNLRRAVRDRRGRARQLSR